MIAPEDAAGPEADLYPAGFIPNIMRALSLVPDQVRALQRSSDAHYVPVPQIGNPSARRFTSTRSSKVLNPLICLSSNRRSSSWPST